MDEDQDPEPVVGTGLSRRELLVAAAALALGSAVPAAAGPDPRGMPFDDGTYFDDGTGWVD